MDTQTRLGLIAAQLLTSQPSGWDCGPKSLEWAAQTAIRLDLEVEKVIKLLASTKPGVSAQEWDEYLDHKANGCSLAYHEYHQVRRRLNAIQERFSVLEKKDPQLKDSEIGEEWKRLLDEAAPLEVALGY